MNRVVCKKVRPGVRQSPWLAALAVVVLGGSGPAAAQEMSFEEYAPRSTLEVPEHLLTRARFPFVDIHNHLRGSLTPERVDGIVAEMDRLNMAVFVNLSGGSGERLKSTVQALKGRYPHRFVVFANPSYQGIDDPAYPLRTAAQLEDDVKNGAQGLKIFKNLGMSVFDARGNRVPVDDPRLDPLWAKAGELGVPVLIHTADPAPFWEPHDRYNERWLELKERPNRKREGEPTWERLIAEQTHVFRKHPETTFIAAHFMWMANDLERLGKVLDELPNVVTELGAVIYEPGRQPRFAARFFEKYQDRILMGKDVWEPREYGVYFRVLETADEYFDYYRKRHAFWKMYGLDLPAEVLRKVYYENALRIVPGLDTSLFPGRSHLPSRHTVPSDGHPMAVWEKRPVEPRAVVLLLHGRTWSGLPDFDLQAPGGNLSLMDGLVERGFVTYALDQRGYGGTPRDDTGWLTPDRAVADLEHVLEWVRAREPGLPVHLFGWSYGTMQSQLLAQRRPDLVDRLVLFGYPWRPGTVVPMQEGDPGPPPRKVNTAAAAASDFITEGAIGERAVKAYVQAALEADPVRVDWTALHQWNALDPTAVTVPTLVIHGEFDPLAPREAQAALFRGLGTSDKAWVVVPGGDHAAFLETPRPYFLAVLEAFLLRGGG